MRGSTRRSALAALVASCAACGSSREAPPPLPSVLVVVDTDLPKPRLAGRLRVDLFRENGTWFASRDIGLPNADQWPASFGIESPDESRPTRVLVRLRAYPSGQVRDHRGERYVAKPTFEARHAPLSVAEMCEAEIELKIGGTAVLRRGKEIFQEVYGPNCNHGGAVYTGIAAAFVDIEEAGRYTFAALDTDPGQLKGLEPDNEQVMLQLRRTCESAAGAIDCRDATTDAYHWTLPVIDADLAPGRYHLVVGSAFKEMAPSDVLVGAAKSGEIGLLPARLAPPKENADGYPLALDGGDTPTTEPLPEMTIDRLLLVELVPGVARTHRVVLRGDCLATMAKLGEGRVDVAAAQSCIDAARPFVPVAVQTEDDAPATDRFGDSLPCPPKAGPDDDRVCIPGGAFVLGGGLVDGFGGRPLRTVAVSTFVLDRHEVTIADWKRAVAEGIVIGDKDDLPRQPAGSSMRCLSVLKTNAYDEYPLDCINWYGARAYCQFRGGDLPTEAQWEYAATQAGRAQKTLFPWGDDAPRCACPPGDNLCHAPVYSRGDRRADTGWAVCLDPTDPGGTSGPLPVMASLDGGDVTPLGVIGLAGNATEWVLDRFVPYDHPCWTAFGPRDAACRDGEGPRHVVRGGSWWNTDTKTLAYTRQGVLPVQLSFEAGMRCAYPVMP
jgi:formylglycine-generating enzyme required for sulfatase activity